MRPIIKGLLVSLGSIFVALACLLPSSASALQVLSSFCGVASSDVTIGPNNTIYGVAEECSTSPNGYLYSITQDPQTHAFVFTDLHDFAGSPGDGQLPAGEVAVDPQGDVFGTTELGGSGNSSGIVYELSAAGVYSVVHNFTGLDGARPVGRLTLARNGTLYGATGSGGAAGFGTLYGISASGVFHLIWSFGNLHTPAEGQAPTAGPIVGPNGVLYGSTKQGGTGSTGTLYQITPGQKLIPLYSFPAQPSGGPGGLEPLGQIAIDTSGNLFGTTIFDNGACGDGTLFEYTPSSNTYSTLYSFGVASGCPQIPPDGRNPRGDLAIDSVTGDIYGATAEGGNPSQKPNNPVGDGTIFQFSPSTGVLTTIYGFTDADVAFQPGFGVIFADNQSILVSAAGNLFTFTSPSTVVALRK